MSRKLSLQESSKSHITFEYPCLTYIHIMVLISKHGVSNEVKSFLHVLSRYTFIGVQIQTFESRKM